MLLSAHLHVEYIYNILLTISVNLMWQKHLLSQKITSLPLSKIYSEYLSMYQDLNSPHKGLTKMQSQKRCIIVSFSLLQKEHRLLLLFGVCVKLPNSFKKTELSNLWKYHISSFFPFLRFRWHSFHTFFAPLRGVTTTCFYIVFMLINK